MKIYRDETINKINDKLILANIKIDATKYLNIKYIILIIFLLMLLIKFNYLSLIFILLYICLYDYIVIQININKRIKKLENEALQFFDILLLTLDSTSNLEKCLEVVIFNLDNEISNEFKNALVEIKFGKTLNEALESLKNRMPSKTIQNIITRIIESNIYGNDLIKTLSNQIDYLKEKEFLEVKGEINKIPNKISIVTVVFIVPMILLIILGPLLIKILI